MSKAILIIDDDVKMIRLLTQYFSPLGIELRSAVKPSDGLKIIKEQSPALVILDVMLPEMSGLEVCKEIRLISAVPIVMLTARGDVADRIVGLELGADDYLPKPFEPRELLARIQSVLRRDEKSKVVPLTATKILKFEHLEVDVAKKIAKLDGAVLDLTTMEFETLAFFASNPTRVLSRNEILDHLRGIDWEAYNRSIDVIISRLRQKLKDDPKQPTYFKTVWGSGYMFIADANDERKSA
jgi:DNA-binding response OmpR family regulator